MTVEPELRCGIEAKLDSGRDGRRGRVLLTGRASCSWGDFRSPPENDVDLGTGRIGRWRGTRSPRAWILGIVGTLLWSPGAGAATWTVDLRGVADFVDIQAALDAAGDGDTVLVRAGEYVIEEPLDFNRLHDPADPSSPPVKHLTLKSETGPRETTLRMSEEPTDPKRASVLVFRSGEGATAVLEGFRCTGGRGTDRGEEWWERGGRRDLLHQPFVSDAAWLRDLRELGAEWRGHLLRGRFLPDGRRLRHGRELFLGGAESSATVRPRRSPVVPFRGTAQSGTGAGWNASSHSRSSEPARSQATGRARAADSGATSPLRP